MAHPEEWRASGYHELAGRRRRYRVLSIDRLLWCLGMPGGVAPFGQWYAATINELVGPACGRREHMWTESVAAGGRGWVEGLADRIVAARTSSRRRPPMPHGLRTDLLDTTAGPKVALPFGVVERLTQHEADELLGALGRGCGRTTAEASCERSLRQGWSNKSGNVGGALRAATRCELRIAARRALPH